MIDTTVISAEIDPVINGAANVASALLPQYGALILLGAGLIKSAPQLYADAVALVQKKDPTPADEAALDAKIAALANPETL
jgi:hypothetical protein